MNNITNRAAAIPVPLLIVGATRPTPAPNPCTIMVVNAGLPPAATASCHSAVEEQPIVPTLPLDHGCLEIHDSSSSPSERWAENVVVALREEVTAFVHLNKRVATLDGSQLICQFARSAIAHVPEVDVVGCAHKDGWLFL